MAVSEGLRTADNMSINFIFYFLLFFSFLSPPVNSHSPLCFLPFHQARASRYTRQDGVGVNALHYNPINLLL